MKCYLYCIKHHFAWKLQAGQLASSDFSFNDKQLELKAAAFVIVRMDISTILPAFHFNGIF